jgi:hypothetical protein
MDFIDYLTEAPEKHGVLTYGRMNPPTSGHEQVINKVHEVLSGYSSYATFPLEEDYCLIHQESSIGKYDLKINS